MRAFDWSSTTLGAPEGWPSSLRASIRVMLTSRFAMWMAFGPDLTFFCNDAYLPTTGNKSDWVLGARSDKVWAEIWPDIGPRIEQVLATGEATWDEALLLYLVRRGYAEETYHTFSYSPLDDDEGRPAGMLCVVAEVTEKVIGARQLDVLRDLGSHLAAARTRSEVMRAFEASLQAEPRDLPFSLTYFVSGDATQVDLAASHGLTREAGFAAANIGVGDPDAPWPVEGALEGHVQLVTLSPSGLGDFALDFWQTPPANAFVVPVMSAGARAVGFFVAGLNPHRAFDADYRGFVDLVAAQLAAAVARADEFDRATARAEALAEIDQAKTTFFSNVSHEFRTPLTLMLGPLEEALAENATLPALERDRLQVVHRNGLRLLKLVNSLLDFSRIEAGRLQASFVPTDLAAMTADLASSFSTAVEKAGLSLIIDCRKLSAPVYIDHDMWEKVVLNLLSNAFKFTFEGSIAIRVQERHGEAEIVVQDTGIGIAADEMPRLFERFHRIEGARGRSHEGTGIGLALVWELLKLQGGTIKVESEPDVGTTFIIAFPFGKSHLPQDRVRDGGLPAPITARARAFLEEATHWPGAANQDVPVAHPARVPPDPSPIAATGRRPRVLFADDNHDMRGYVSRLLATECDVQSVPDGLAALQAARANTPDLILTDVMMPRLDGFGLVHAIRTDPALRGIPIIMLSARAGEEASIEGREAGVDDYLAKPFSAAELRARVRVNLALAKLRKAAVLSLSESERRFRAAVDAVDGILWTNNAAGEMEGPQPGWSALTGQAYDDYQGFGWARAVHPDDAQPTINAWNDAVAERRPFAFEHRVRRHDGAWRIFAIRAIPILSEDGSIREWVGVHTDIRAPRKIPFPDAGAMRFPHPASFGGMCFGADEFLRH
jgi:PAS domain S-box-containing protein